MSRWRGAGAVALAGAVSAWPFLDFVEQNTGQLTAGDLAIVAAAWGLLFAVGLAAAAALARLARVPLLFAALPASAAAALFFFFESFTGYVLVAAPVAAAFWLLVRRPGWRAPLVAFAAVIALAPAPAVMAFAWKLLAAEEPAAAALHPAWAGKLRITPNIHHIVLDGYAHADTLARMAGLDNRPFLEALERRGFTIAGGATANYPSTYLSIASVLGMDYVAVPGEPYRDRRRFYALIRGASPVVRGLRRHGYRILHSGNAWSGSSCSGREDLCLNSLTRRGAAIGEVGDALVRRTPLGERLGGAALVGWQGDLDGIREALDSVYASEPLYLFAHSLPPHPPFFLRADCSARPVEGSIDAWIDREAYRDAVLCVNRKILRLVDAILARDPGALIVLHADHGSGFQGQVSAGLEDWTPAMIEERFRIFLAIRAPRSCARWIDPAMSAVNLFRFVAACLRQEPPHYLPARFYAAPGEADVDFGAVRALSPPW